jgi:hypothetical protein
MGLKNQSWSAFRPIVVTTKEAELQINYTYALMLLGPPLFAAGASTPS